MQTLNLDLGERSYPIHIGQGLLQQAELVTPHIKGKSAVVVTNTTVAPLYLDATQRLLTGLKHSAVILPDGEGYKNLDVLNQIYTHLLENKADRKTTLIALGGGVVGDMTGYAALPAINAVSTSSRFQRRYWQWSILPSAAKLA